MNPQVLRRSHGGSERRVVYRRQRAGGRINGKNIKMVVTGGAADPDGVFAGKVSADQSHVQPERAARNSGKRAVALVNREGVNRKEWRSLSDIEKRAATIDSQKLGEVQVEGKKW